MMPFSLSIGDVIVISGLIKDAIKAFDDSRGSAAEYQEVIRELWFLDRALLGVIDFVSRASETSFELKSLCDTVEQNVRHCHQCIGTFLSKIERYKKSLTGGACLGELHIRSASDTLKWAIKEKAELAKFRTEITGYTSAINMSLMTVNMHTVKTNGENFQSLNTRISEYGQKADQQLTLLRKVFQMVLKNNSQQERQGQALSSLLGSFQYLYSLGGELKSMMIRMWSQNTRMNEVLMDLQTRIPREFGPRWIQDPVIFTDAHGRVAPLPLELINSWSVLEKILAIRFENLPGQSKIKKKEYIFRDQNLGSDIDVSLPYEHSFRPGRRIHMSMVFRQSSTGSSCPGCQLESNADLQVEIQCQGCGLVFQRLEESLDDPAFVIQKSVAKSCSGVISSERVENHEVTPDDAINAFQRVRVLCIKSSSTKNEPMDSPSEGNTQDEFGEAKTILSTETDESTAFLLPSSLSKIQLSSNSHGFKSTPLMGCKKKSSFADIFTGMGASRRAERLSCEKQSRREHRRRSDSGESSDEETSEMRVRRIKLRVAELTVNIVVSNQEKHLTCNPLGCSSPNEPDMVEFGRFEQRNKANTNIRVQPLKASGKVRREINWKLIVNGRPSIDDHLDSDSSQQYEFSLDYVNGEMQTENIIELYDGYENWYNSPLND